MVTELHDIEDVIDCVRNSSNSHKSIYRTGGNIFVATISETSLTINNIVYIIDCGVSKQKIYSPNGKSITYIIKFRCN